MTYSSTYEDIICVLKIDHYDCPLIVILGVVRSGREIKNPGLNREVREVYY